MNKEIAKVESSVVVEALRNSLYPGAKTESVLMVLSYCKAAGLDPMTKPVHIVPMQVKDAKSGNKEWRDVIMPGIELYRIKAANSQAYAGSSEPEFGPDKTIDTVNRWGNNVKVVYPEWCRVTVRRRLFHGDIVEFTSKEIWLENYANDGKTDAPNAMWTKRPYAQLAKCAEAQALRKGFPEIGAQPTADEMAGKVIEQAEIIDPTRGMKPETTAPEQKKPEPKKETKKAANDTKAETERKLDEGEKMDLGQWKNASNQAGNVAEWWPEASKKALEDLGKKQFGMLENYIADVHSVKL